MNECPPGKHRTLVLIDTGYAVEDIEANPYICLNCGDSFAGVRVHMDDPQIEEVLRRAAANTKDNLKKLRLPKQGKGN